MSDEEPYWHPEKKLLAYCPYIDEPITKFNDGLRRFGFHRDNKGHTGSGMRAVLPTPKGWVLFTHSSYMFGEWHVRHLPEGEPIEAKTVREVATAIMPLFQCGPDDQLPMWRDLPDFWKRRIVSNMQLVMNAGPKPETTK